MPWDGNGNFTRTDGTRSGSEVWTEADAAAVGIESDDHDVHDQDMADGIEACLAKNGENSPTADIDWGGFRITNLGNILLEDNRVIMDADEDTYWQATADDVLALVVGGETVGTFENTGSIFSKFTLRANEADATVGPDLVLYRDSATPAAEDALGQLQFDGEDSAGNQDSYAAIRGRVIDPTSTSEDGAIDFYATIAGSLTRMMRLSGTQAELISTDAGAAVAPLITLYRNSATPAASDIMGGLNFDGEDSAGNQDTYASIRSTISDPTSTSEDGELNFYVSIAGTLTEIVEFREANGVPQIRLNWTDSGSSEGPYLTGRRISSSPAANDACFAIQGIGRDSGANDTTYCKISFDIADPTDTSEDGSISIHVQDGGTLSEYARFTNSQLLIGKTTGGVSQQGVQMGIGGILMASSDAATPGHFNRKTNDGKLIAFYQDDTEEGDISVSGTTVSLTGFTGAHASSWADVVEVDPPIGSLVSVAEVEHKLLHPCVRLTGFSEDRRVYGVFAGRKEGGALQIYASGVAAVRVVGPVHAGDLLTSSHIPGVAMRQGDDVVRSSTVGKVTLADALEGERMVPCVLYCG